MCNRAAKKVVQSIRRVASQAGRQAGCLMEMEKDAIIIIIVVIIIIMACSSCGVSIESSGSQLSE